MNPFCISKIEEKNSRKDLSIDNHNFSNKIDSLKNNEHKPVIHTPCIDYFISHTWAVSESLVSSCHSENNAKEKLAELKTKTINEFLIKQYSKSHWFNWIWSSNSSKSSNNNNNNSSNSSNHNSSRMLCPNSIYERTSLSLWLDKVCMI